MNLTERSSRRLMRRGNWRFVAEKTAVAAGYALTPRLRYGNVFSLLRLRFEGGGCGTNGDTRFAKRTKLGGFNTFTAQSGSVSVAITETARPTQVDG
jgi:hypothetical protein